MTRTKHVWTSGPSEARRCLLCNCRYGSTTEDPPSNCKATVEQLADFARRIVSIGDDYPLSFWSMVREWSFFIEGNADPDDE